jgi:hypothetical protein
MTPWRWKHWEVKVGRWRLARWCDGAPCFQAMGYGERLALTPNRRHPVRAWRVRGASR